MTETDATAPQAVPQAPEGELGATAATPPQPLEGEALASVTGGFGFQVGSPLGPGFGTVPWNGGTWPYSFPVVYEMPDR